MDIPRNAHSAPSTSPYKRKFGDNAGVPRPHRQFHDVICDNCGETFHASRKDARYCSPRCRAAWVREWGDARFSDGFKPEQLDALLKIKRAMPDVGERIINMRVHFGLVAARETLSIVVKVVRFYKEYYKGWLPPVDASTTTNSSLLARLRRKTK